MQALQRSAARAPDQQFSARAAARALRRGRSAGAAVGAAHRRAARRVAAAGGPLDLDVAEVDLVALVARGRRARAQPTAAASGSTVTLEAPASVRGRFDASRVDQIVTNLLSNAIKYGRGKPIGVRLVVEQRASGARALTRAATRASASRPRITRASSSASSARCRARTTAGSGSACGSRGRSRESLGGALDRRERRAARARASPCRCRCSV